MVGILYTKSLILILPMLVTYILNISKIFVLQYLILILSNVFFLNNLHFVMYLKVVIPVPWNHKDIFLFYSTVVFYI